MKNGWYDMLQFYKIFGSVPKVMKDELIYVHRNNCLKFRIVGNAHFDVGISGHSKLASIGAEAGVSALLELKLASAIVGDGPKIVQPDRLNLEAAEYIDLNFPTVDYHQPFPTMIVELPDDYGQNRMVQCGQYGHQHYPIFCMIHHEAVTGIIIVGVYYYKIGGERQQCFTFGICPTSDLTIEQEFELYRKAGSYKGSLEVSDEENNVSMNIARASINILSLMYEVGTISLGPINPDHYERCKKKINHKNPKIAQLNRDAIADMPIIYTFAQEVRLYKTENQGANVQTGRTMSVHWRKGYRRKQHYGPNNSLTKIVFIKPVLVNAHRFGGDISDTEVIYHE